MDITRLRFTPTRIPEYQTCFLKNLIDNYIGLIRIVVVVVYQDVFRWVVCCNMCGWQPLPSYRGWSYW